MEALWNSMAAYNAATWPFQLAFMAAASVLTLILLFRPCTWAKVAMKVYMVAVSLWIAFVYYMKFGSGREYSFVLTIFWCMMAAAWVYDLVTHFSSFSKSGKYRPWGIVMLMLPLCYPLISLARGLEFPCMTTPLIPSAVALYMLGVLMTFNSRINFFALIFIFHWSVIAVSKIMIFNIPEDLLLVVSCLPAMFIFSREAALSFGGPCKPPAQTISVLIFVVMALIGACMLVQYV